LKESLSTKAGGQLTVKLKGLAFVYVKETEAEPAIDHVKLHTQWPKSQSTKVPSAISYSRSPGRRKQWGHDIEPGSEVMRWTKLELEEAEIGDEINRLRDAVKGLRLMTQFTTETRDRVLNHDIPHHLGMDAEYIVTEYLSHVFREWYDVLAAEVRSLFENISIDLVITHPSNWSYKAQNKTVRAVLGAFSKKVFPTLRNISLFTEPEACALYTAHRAALADRARLHPVSFQPKRLSNTFR
jgi:hypothetical protein